MNGLTAVRQDKTFKHIEPAKAPKSRYAIEVTPQSFKIVCGSMAGINDVSDTLEALEAGLASGIVESVTQSSRYRVFVKFVNAMAAIETFKALQIKVIGSQRVSDKALEAAKLEPWQRPTLAIATVSPRDCGIEADDVSRFVPVVPVSRIAYDTSDTGITGRYVQSVQACECLDCRILEAEKLRGEHNLHWQNSTTKRVKAENTADVMTSPNFHNLIQNRRGCNDFIARSKRVEVIAVERMLESEHADLVLSIHNLKADLSSYASEIAVLQREISECASYGIPALITKLNTEITAKRESYDLGRLELRKLELKLKRVGIETLADIEASHKVTLEKLKAASVESSTKHRKAAPEYTKVYERVAKALQRAKREADKAKAAKLEAELKALKAFKAECKAANVEPTEAAAMEYLNVHSTKRI